jgi:hypothetical protein
MKFKDIRIMNFYPFGLEALTLVLIKKLFNYNDSKFKEMGIFQAKVSFIIRLFLKYFISIDRICKEFPKISREHFSIGDFEVSELNKEKKYIVLRINNFKFHPLHCQVLKGVLLGGLQMVVKGFVTCDEIKCIYKGDDYHEFLLKW